MSLKARLAQLANCQGATTSDKLIAIVTLAGDQPDLAWSNRHFGTLFLSWRPEHKTANIDASVTNLTPSQRGIIGPADQIAALVGLPGGDPLGIDWHRLESTTRQAGKKLTLIVHGL